MGDDMEDVFDYLRSCLMSNISHGSARDVEMCSKTITCLERLNAAAASLHVENERLRAEVDKVCDQHSLVRCKGCGDYISHKDIADKENGYCWGCQDEIDDSGEIGEEYLAPRED